MTGGTAWVIGRIVHDTVAPAIAAQSIATPDLVRAALILVGGRARQRRRHRRSPGRRRSRGLQPRRDLPAPGHPPVPAPPARLAPPAPVRPAAVQRELRRRVDVERLPAAADGVRRRRHARLRRRPDGPRRPVPRRDRADRLPDAPRGQPAVPARHVAEGDARPADARRGLRGRARELRGGARRQEPRPRGPGGRAVHRGDARAARRQHRASAARRGVFDPAIEAIPTIGTLAVIAVGAWRIGTGHITAAEVVQIAYLFSILAFPVRALGWVLAEMPRSVVGWDRVTAVLDATGR